ncbi:uncharacterized protein LOC107364571 [Tetranychus urticae]|nr:uncharacterized protein LOC107364571 [Tetranychus urticae]
MPLFSDKFNPRLSKPRKSNPIGSRSFVPEKLDESYQLIEFKSLNLDLGDQLMLHFDETKGQWINEEDEDETAARLASKESNNNKAELVKLKKTIETLHEENRMLKLKVELLVDLVIEKGETTD